jgi:AcrR family transcriptional regulator
MRKGEQTREAILERAWALASQVGLEGLTIGRLAEELDLSKSGLFAHFQSKEQLQLETLERAAERFDELVTAPALAFRRGEPRLRALFENWLRWPELVPQPGGCIFLAAAVEYDDRPGVVRDFLVKGQNRLLRSIADAARTAVEEGHFGPGVDPEQFAFEMFGVVLAAHLTTRLLRDAKATERAQRAFDGMVEAARIDGR